jgi:hypothetical protein
MDMSALKKIQGEQAKAALKRQLLPNYEGGLKERWRETAGDRMK